MILATPPSLNRPHLDWLLVGLALVLPWAWLVALDRLLKRTR